MQYRRAPLLREYPLLHAFHDAHARDGVHDGHGHGDDVRVYDLQNQRHKHGRGNAHDPPRGYVRDNAHGLLHDCVRDDAHGLPRSYVRGCDHEHGDDCCHHGYDRDHEGIPYHDHGFHAQHPE